MYLVCGKARHNVAANMQRTTPSLRLLVIPSLLPCVLFQIPQKPKIVYSHRLDICPCVSHNAFGNQRVGGSNPTPRVTCGHRVRYDISLSLCLVLCFGRPRASMFSTMRARMEVIALGGRGAADKRKERRCETPPACRGRFQAHAQVALPTPGVHFTCLSAYYHLTLTLTLLVGWS